jgi:hypothetical protein
MGIFANLRSAAANRLATGPLNVGNLASIDRSLNRLEAHLGEQDATVGGVVNEVQSIAAATGASAGTYTLTVLLANDETFTTGNINHNANAATITSAINTAAAGVTDWTNGDIVVGGGPLHTTAVTLTFSGASVAGANHALTTVDSTSLTGGVAGAVTVTTSGGSSRPAWAVLVAAGVVIGSEVPEQGEDASLSATATNVNNNPYYPEADVIRFLAAEAAVGDDNEQVATEILRVAGL